MITSNTNMLVLVLIGVAAAQQQLGHQGSHHDEDDTLVTGKAENHIQERSADAGYGYGGYGYGHGFGLGGHRYGLRGYHYGKRSSDRQNNVHKRSAAPGYGHGYGYGHRYGLGGYGYGHSYGYGHGYGGYGGHFYGKRASEDTPLSGISKRE